MIKKKLSFKLPNPVLYCCQIPNVSQLLIKYYTDCVHEPLEYKVNYKVQNLQKQKQEISNEKQDSKVIQQIQMDFNFLIQQIKIHQKILDNIGVIKFESIESTKKNVENKQYQKQDNHKVKETWRLGILVTKQKGLIYVSLIQ